MENKDIRGAVEKFKSKVLENTFRAPLDWSQDRLGFSEETALDLFILEDDQVCIAYEEYVNNLDRVET